MRKKTGSLSKNRDVNMTIEICECSKCTLARMSEEEIQELAYLRAMNGI